MNALRATGRALRGVILLPAFATLAMLALCGSARAVDASTYLLLPTVTLGEREIDLRYGDGSSGPLARGERNAGLGFGMGVSERWFSELSVQYRGIHGQPTGFDAVEWENIVQLAEQDEWNVDVGLLLEIERPKDPREGISLRMGPLLQKEFGRFQLNANALVSRHFQTAEFVAVQWRYQLQAKYRYSPPLEFGLQAFGNLSTSAHVWVPYEHQAHRIGPVVMGKFTVGNERSLLYNAAFLFGTTDHSPDRTFRLQLEYEF